jgi:hypothetical protein
MYKPKYKAVSQMRGNKRAGLAHSNSVALQTAPDPNSTQFDPKTGEAKARELAKKRAEEAWQQAGENKGGSKNVRTFKGEASYVIPGRPVEKYAKTPEEIAAWKKARPEIIEEYEDKEVGVVETVSDTGVDKQKPKENKKNDRVSFYKGSNAHNMNFGGHTSYGRIIGEVDLSKQSKSYTVSPEKPISGRPNTFEHREATDREIKAMNSGFFNNTASPYDEGQTEAGWNDYLTRVENRESQLQSKISERKKSNQNKNLEIQKRKQALEAKKAEKAAKITPARKKK